MGLMTPLMMKSMNMEPDGQLWLETITQTGEKVYINSIKSLSTLIKQFEQRIFDSSIK